MKLKRFRKRMVLGLTVAMGLSSGVLPVQAVTGNEVAADNHYQGMARVEGDGFEGYDINLDFDVIEGNFANIRISSENMASYNNSFRTKAENKLKMLEGTPATVSNANTLDEVSGATFTTRVGKRLLVEQLGTAASANPVASVLDKFEVNQVYEVSVQLRKMSERSELSMANDFITQKAEIWMDESGELHIACQFPRGEKFGVSNAYVTGFKLLEAEGGAYRDFELTRDDQNNSYGHLTLPSVKEDGFYQGKIDANIMKNNDVFLLVDWNTMVGKGNQDTIFRNALAEARAVSPSFYSAKSYGKVSEALSGAEPIEQNSSASLAEKYLAGYKLRYAIASLEEISSSPFLNSNQRYFVDVTSTDDKIKSSVYYEAVVDNNAEKQASIQVTFEKGQNYKGEFLARNVEIFNAEGERITQQSYAFDEGLGKGVLTFTPDTFPKSGEFKVGIGHNQDNEILNSTIVFDWQTIRTGADFRPLRKLVEACRQEIQENYMPKSFAHFKAILDEAEGMLANENESQDKLNEMVAKLSAAKDSLMIIENTGSGNTVNPDLKHLNTPYVQPSEDKADKAWAGSRIYFGKENVLWRVLDKENGLVLADEYFVRSKYHQTKVSRAPRWNASSMRDYLNTTLINELFSEAEQEFIKVTTIVQDKKTTEDKLFLLSIEDYNNAQYGFVSNKSKSLAERQWTRSRGWSDIQTLETTGAKLEHGGIPYLKEYAARPALTLDLEKLAEKTLFVVSSELDTNQGLAPVVSTTDNTWRILLKDETITLAASNIKINNEDKVVGQFETNLSAGKIMAAIVSKENDKEIKAFGKVADIGASSFRNGNTSSTGEFSLKLPESFNKDTDQVVLFAQGSNPAVASSLTKVNVEDALAEREALRTAKAEALAEVEKLADLTNEHREAIKQEIEQMTSPNQKDELVQKAANQDVKDREDRLAREALEREKRLAKEALDRAKAEAKEALAKLVHLTDAHRADILSKIEALSAPMDKEPIIEEAKQVDEMDRLVKLEMDKKEEDKSKTDTPQGNENSGVKGEETKEDKSKEEVKEVKSSKDKEAKKETKEKVEKKSTENKSKSKKTAPKTGDDIRSILGVSLVSLTSLFVMLFTFKKKSVRK